MGGFAIISKVLRGSIVREVRVRRRVPLGRVSRDKRKDMKKIEAYCRRNAVDDGVTSVVASLPDPRQAWARNSNSTN